MESRPEVKKDILFLVDELMGVPFFIWANGPLRKTSLRMRLTPYQGQVHIDKRSEPQNGDHKIDDRV